MLVKDLRPGDYVYRGEAAQSAAMLVLWIVPQLDLNNVVLGTLELDGRVSADHFLPWWDQFVLVHR